MPWWSVNPQSEPTQTVRMVAHILGKQAQEVSSTDLADVYNALDGDDDSDSNTGNSWNAQAWDDIFDDEDED